MQAASLLKTRKSGRYRLCGSSGSKRKCVLWFLNTCVLQMENSTGSSETCLARRPGLMELSLLGIPVVTIPTVSMLTIYPVWMPEGIYLSGRYRESKQAIQSDLLEQSQLCMGPGSHSARVLVLSQLQVAPGSEPGPRML